MNTRLATTLLDIAAEVEADETRIKRHISVATCGACGASRPYPIQSGG